MENKSSVERFVFEEESFNKERDELNDNDKELVVYRKISELTGNNISIKDISSELEKDKFIDEDFLLNMLISTGKGKCKKILECSMCNNANKYRKLYKESLLSLRKVLENYKQLAQELKISNNSLYLSHLFTYLLWNGYFSVSKTHAYRVDNRLLLPGMYSFEVIKGRGVCLSYSELLHNFLTICDIKSAFINCKVNQPVEFNYTPDINTQIEITKLNSIVNQFRQKLCQGLINKFGNHAVNLIQENKKMYVYDCTNLSVLNIFNINKARVINGCGEFELKLLESLVFHPYCDPFQLFEQLQKYNMESAFNRKEIIFSFENIVELMNTNLNLLNDAYTNIHNQLEIIDRQTDELGMKPKESKKQKTYFSQ